MCVCVYRVRQARTGATAGRVALPVPHKTIGGVESALAVLAAAAAAKLAEGGGVAVAVARGARTRWGGGVSSPPPRLPRLAVASYYRS